MNVYVDTGGWIAYFDQSDRFHPLVTSYVQATLLQAEIASGLSQWQPRSLRCSGGHAFHGLSPSSTLQCAVRNGSCTDRIKTALSGKADLEKPYGCTRANRALSSHSRRLSHEGYGGAHCLRR